MSKQDDSSVSSSRPTVVVCSQAMRRCMSGVSGGIYGGISGNLSGGMSGGMAFTPICESFRRDSDQRQQQCGSNSSDSRDSSNLPPKTIWTYWDNHTTPDEGDAGIPKTVEMCIKGWKDQNPQYRVILLNKKSPQISEIIPKTIRDHHNFHDNPTRFADLVRLWVLAAHGGVWADASVVLKEPLDDWLFVDKEHAVKVEAEFSGFYIDGFTKDAARHPVIENWFFACRKGSPFVELWKKEFTEIANYPSVAEYVDSRRIVMKVDYEGIDDPVYLAMHVAAQKILQYDNYPLASLILRKAEDGPLRYLVDAGWDSEKAVCLACNSQYQTPILKLRGAERKVVESKICEDPSSKPCGYLFTATTT